jgi:hypothetical protein
MLLDTATDPAPSNDVEADWRQSGRNFSRSAPN